MKNENLNEESKEKKEAGRKINKTERKEKRKTGMNGGIKVFLHICQHLCLVLAVVMIACVFLGAFVIVENRDGEREGYRLTEEDTGIPFEDTELFNRLLGKNVSDIICYGAIRGQMETDGRFDAKKVVDTTAFANRYKGIQEEYITAGYYLDDLIKWAQNGFVTETRYMSGEEADGFLSRTRTVTFVNLNNGNYKGGTVSYLNSDVESFTRVFDVSGNILDMEEPIRDDVNATILNNRYHSVDGKNIENYVSSWDEYYELCANVEKAAKDLEINYREYLKYNDYYKTENTNLTYYIRRTIGEDTQVFSNRKTESSDFDKLKKQLKASSSRYIIYDPKNMSYETNTLIEEETLRYILNGYEYSYPEDTQILIGVGSLQAGVCADDMFSQAMAGYNNYVPYFWQYLIAAVVLGFLYLALLVILTAREGSTTRKGLAAREGRAALCLRPEDRVPGELMLVFAAGAGAGIYISARLIIERLDEMIQSEILLPFAGALALVVSLLFSFFYYSLVRRIKAKILWKNSLLYRLCRFVKEKALYFYDNAAIVLRVWLPFAAFILIHVGLLIGLKRYGVIIALVLDAFVGIILYKSAQARQLILQGIKRIKDGDIEHKIEETTLHGDNLVLAQAVNSIGDGIRSAVATSMKDERLKADLITNVSHDIKTPLTSIINYVDLIKRENIDNPKIKEYIDVLDIKSQRLKQLTDDLVEASKISSGNIALQWEKINLVELLNQTIGEFSEKFEEKALIPVFQAEHGSIFIEADSRRIWRVIENLFNNIFKYALSGTRVYIDLEELETENDGRQVTLSIKNISANPLKVKPEELTERFIRGDESRTTEGSGLGLSIAKSLTEAQKGKFEIIMDGDLFKVVLTFPLLEQS